MFRTRFFTAKEFAAGYFLHPVQQAIFVDSQREVAVASESRLVVTVGAARLVSTG